MLKKTIKYEDYDGNERTEDFYFNLNEAELTELRLSVNGGIEKMLERIVKEQDAPTIIATVKEILLKAYGKKSDDGRVFLKSPEISHEFECTEAYNELFMEICKSPEDAANFFNALLPAKLQKAIAEQEAKEKLAENAKN